MEVQAGEEEELEGLDMSISMGRGSSSGRRNPRHGHGRRAGIPGEPKTCTLVVPSARSSHASRSPARPLRVSQTRQA